MRIGSLFSGYGGLDIAAAEVFGGRVVWHAEIDPGASAILAHHHPDMPNLGDITAVDWSAVEPVDVLTGGFPCQDVSAAGKRAGIRPGTRSGLWAQFAYAIDELRPRFVVIENVRGLLSAAAHSDVEPDPWGMGDGESVPLRALGAVLGDLADLGYDASWHGLRASDVGAPHGRFRVFITARPAADPGGVRGHSRRLTAPGQASSGWSLSVLAGRCGASAADPESHGRDEGWSEPARIVRGSDDAIGGASVEWGRYEPAIRRWERLTRPAPTPTEPSAKGSPRLSPAFVEWMMGLPAGWVTDVPKLTRNQQLKALGNGVVPQQAVAALRILLADTLTTEENAA